MTREATFLGYLAISGATGLALGLAARRQSWAPKLLLVLSTVMLVCATWLTGIAAIMQWRNHTENLAHIPLPGPGWPTGMAVSLFAFAGLGLPGLLLSAVALPSAGPRRATLKAVCITTAVYAP